MDSDLNIQQRVFYEALKAKRDGQGIVRYNPEAFEKELNMLSTEIDEMLNTLYTRGILVYVTRINKETGEILKVVQLIREENS